MSSARALFASGLLASVLTASALAESTKGGRLCPQSLAGYGTANQEIMLEFSGSADGAFRVLLGDGAARLQGFVYPGEDDDVNLAVVLNDCPDGDATGEELAACTVWQGPIVAQADDGGAVPLPGSDQPAASALLLDGFAEALTGSPIYEEAGLSVRDFDTLTLQSCQE